MGALVNKPRGRGSWCAAQGLGLLVLALSPLAWGTVPSGEPVTGCAADDESLARWRAVRAAPDDGDPNVLALPLAECLASANAELRDRIAYELLTYWLREGRITPATAEDLRSRLQPWLLRNESEWVLGRAFAALVLSELVRFDTGTRRWDRSTVNAVLEDALDALASERDFRGLDGDLGWIHAIAHQSDLLWRLARHPLIGEAELAAILEGVASKVAPEGNHPYVFGEFDRLARVIAAVTERELLAADVLESWIAHLARPRHISEWRQAFASPAGMAELHNTKGFLRALRQHLRPPEHSPSAADGRLRAIDAVLAALP